MPPPDDDRRLLARFRRRDRAAFDALYDRYAGRLLAFALYLNGGCRADAEDLVQETFVAAYRGADSFRGGARLLTWLMGIALRRHRDGTRRPRPPLVLLREEGDADRSSSGSPVEDAAIASVTLRQAVSMLDEPLREAFLLVAAQGLTHREASEVIGAPVGTVKWRVAEATKRLRAALSEKANEEDEWDPLESTCRHASLSIL